MEYILSENLIENQKNHQKLYGCEHYQSISKYGKKNFYYVIIAKNSLLKTTFKNLESELIKIIK